jgi:hypothetical protein
VTTIQLSPLSAQATAAVLAERGGAPISGSFARACRDATAATRC